MPYLSGSPPFRTDPRQLTEEVGRPWEQAAQLRRAAAGPL